MTEPLAWTLKGFCSHFRFVHEKMHDHAFAWVLGAGTSRASGIPTGGELVKAWLHELHQRLDKDEQPFEQWANEENLAIKGFKLAEAASFYPRIYERRFRDHPDEGYAYLEELMAGKDPSPGYSILAKTMDSTRHRVVITTNFDNLVADALAIYTDTFPFVVGHEALTGFVRVAMRRPLVCKIHRDLLLGPKNDPRSLKRLHEAWAVALRSLLAQYTPIFIGYGGNDDSLMDMLESLDPGDIKGQMIWCYYEKDEPSTRIKELVMQHRGVLVPVPDFDLFMILLGSVLGIEPLDAVIQERARKRTTNYRERILALDTSGHPEVAAALSSTLERAGGWWAWELKAQRETNFEKRESIYRQGLQNFPRSHELHHNFAVFMAYHRSKYDDAEQLYRKALELDPTGPSSHVALAIFLSTFREELDQSEALFNKALELEPDDAYTNAAYARFLTLHKKKNEEAERLFRKALDLEPNSAHVHLNFAVFMIHTRKDFDAAEVMLRRAVELEPHSTQFLGALAGFLSDQNKNPAEAESIFREVLKSIPEDHSTLLNYAEFLIMQHRTAEARSVIQRIAGLQSLDSRNRTITLLLTALMDRCNNRDDSQALGKLKSVLHGGFKRRDWNFDGLMRFTEQTLPPDDHELYSALMKAICHEGSISRLDSFERWRLIG